MVEGIRARVATEDEREVTRIAAGKGEITAGEATFRFSVGDSSGTPTDAKDAAATGTDREGETNPAGGSEAANGEETAEDPRYIAPLEAVPTEGTIRCEALGEGRAVEFICRREGEAVFGWRNSCPHEPDVRLDPGWGAMVREGQIVCHEHGARFEGSEGLCTYGPCRGKVLDPLDVSVRGADVYLTDERFEACRRLG